MGKRTERKQAETSLMESRDYLSRIINSIGDPIFVKDHNHKLLLVNDAMSTFMGKTREELRGTDGFFSMPVEMSADIMEDERKVLETGQESVTEETLKDSEQNDRIVLTRKSLFKDKQGNKHLIGTIRDITDYKQISAQLLQMQKLEAIGILAGGVAHDFNNLLNVINGYSELLLEETDEDNPIREDIQQIYKSGQRAADLTSQLLAFSRKQVPQSKMLNLNSVISEMSKMLRRLIREDVEFVFTGATDLKSIFADPAQIQQIIMHLVINAREAMPTGGKLTIETTNFEFDDHYLRKHSAAKAGPYVLLAVSDNGGGIGPEKQSRLFEPFYTAKDRSKESGMGLATVYGIVKQSDGFIWVYSEPGKGTTFKIYFPQMERDPAEPESPVQKEIGGQGSETILVVEDEPAVRALVSRILQDRGYKILEAKNGDDALRKSHEHTGKIDMVLTDVVMPGLSGKKLVSSLGNERPGIKALYISGYTDNAVVHHGILDSDVAFLQKPFTVENLAKKVRNVLDS